MGEFREIFINTDGNTWVGTAINEFAEQNSDGRVLLIAFGGPMWCRSTRASSALAEVKPLPADKIEYT